MIFIQTFFAFIFALSVLIVFHELGHYWMARLCNVKVLRFSLGMGKILYSRKFGPDQTEWALSALPLGGYVKLLDARADDLSQFRRRTGNVNLPARMSGAVLPSLRQGRWPISCWPSSF